MSISKNKAKLIRSLSDKKHRDEQGLFIAEGEKIAGELLTSDYSVETLFASEMWLHDHENEIKKVKEIIAVNDVELMKVSNLSTPNQVIAIVKKKKYDIDVNRLHSSLSLVLDDVQDPGNLGTILRIADWFGIRDVICSENTVDTYNPKVIQSSMGAFLRVHHYHTVLPEFFKTIVTPGFEIYGNILGGKNLYTEKLTSTGLIIMGNESKGIQENHQKYITQQIMIPGYPAGKQGAESLNVAVATGIVCAEFRRRAI